MKKLALVSVIVIALVLGLAAQAMADSVMYTGSGNPLSANGSVTVKATVNPKLQLTITTPAGNPSQTIDFGTLNPGDNPPSQNCTLTVDSNKPFSIDKAMTNAAVWGQLGLTMTKAVGTGVWTSAVRGAGQNFVDTYGLPTVPWTADPTANYNSQVTYTVTQN